MKVEPTKAFEAAQPADLGALSHQLRNLPPGFEWNYVFYDTCAMALACNLGMAGEPTSGAMARAFGLSSREAYQIFNAGYASAYLGKIEISAGMVADRIDAYLASGADGGNP